MESCSLHFIAPKQFPGSPSHCKFEVWHASSHAWGGAPCISWHPDSFQALHCIALPPVCTLSWCFVCSNMACNSDGAIYNVCCWTGQAADITSQEPPYKTLCMCHMCAAWEVSTFPGQGHIPCKHCRQAAEHP
eukprot:970991-Pelagomonas_calceolata.AAC.1